MLDIFQKGRYEPIPAGFKEEGEKALRALAKFQKRFHLPDTDTTINAIRDEIVGRLLGFNLLNKNKHGFDAKKSSAEEYLEVKQCSISSGSLGGTWNDTNEEKAQAFSDPRLYTAVAIWEGASDLQFIVFGQNPALGTHLLRLVRNRPSGSRSTQTIPISKLINDFSFVVVCPSGKTKEEILHLLQERAPSLGRNLRISDIKTAEEVH
ncbi:MAG: hypothetical protein HYY92_02065 [Parcubacteria group bacterium]|nr:hypothetical protein [Parcubacteria group bacterium]